MTTSRMQRILLMAALLVAPLPMMLSCGGNATAPSVAPTYNPAPAVVISGATATPATAAVTFTFTFSQPVSSFPVSAVTVTNGTPAASTIRLSANQYTLVVTPPATGTGTITVAVAAGAFSSAAGVPSTAAASVVQPYAPSGGGGTPTAPTAGAPAPSLAAANVISLYTSSHTYTNITVGDWSPAWGQGGTIADATVGGATVKLMNLVNYQGINISAPNGAVSDPGAINITGKNTLHLSYWTANGTSFNFSPINAATEYAIPSGTLTQGAWTDLEIPITQSGFDLTTIRQIKFDTTTPEIIYLDNIYFHSTGGGGGATAPSAGAPAPTLVAANVISLYTSSHTYTNITVGDWSPAWGQGGTIADATVGGATVKLMNLVNYQGINISSPNGAATDPGVLDITGKNTLHLSYWTANGTSFNFSPINAAGEYAIPSGTLTQGAWTDLEIPITQASFDLTTIRQLKFDTTTPEIIYLDNIYFHGTGGGGATTFPVFGDNYIAGTSFVGFGGSTNALTVDSTEFHGGSASLKILVPGGTAYTGGAIVAATPQDLSAFNAVTFWAKASKTATINVAGIGNDANGGALYSAESTAIPMTTTWTKYTIPIPVPAKATAMTGLFHFAEGPEDGAYTFWLDDIQYEALTGGSVPTATGVTVTWTPIPIVAGSTSQLNPGSNTIAYSFPVLPNGGNLYNVGWGYFTLASSNTAIATVSGTGLVTAITAGTTNITGAVGALTAPGQAVITVSGTAFPTPATLPALPAPPSGSSVISLYASQTGGFVGSTVVDKHTNVQTWLASWSGGTGGTVFPITVGGATANPYQYAMTNAANYVGISLVPDTSAAPPNIVITNEIDISAMTHFHVDFWTPDEATNLQFKVVDGGTDGQINPGYNGIVLLTPNTTPALATGHWVSCDIPFDNTNLGFGPGGNNFPGGNATSLHHFAQLVIIAAGGGHVYIDNLYFWGPSGGGGGGATAPTSGAPAPSLVAANVISLYTSSNTYTNVPVSDWNPNWGQGGTITDAVVGGATVKLMNLVNYQGVAISSNGGDPAGTGVLNLTGKSTLHISYWTANGTSLSFVPIDALDHEFPIASGTLTQGAWTDLELPITNGGFDLATVRQLKFVTTTPEVIYLDNIYFH